MYNENFVVAIKVKNKILRELSGVVYLPFGSEYSILMKNLNTRKAVVSVTVDGTYATKGSRLIIAPGEEIELEGWLDSTKVKNKFKFIKKTKRIERVRGNKLMDGLVTVSFQFEKDPNAYPNIIPYYPILYQEYPIYYNKNTCTTLNKESAATFSCDSGITTKGGLSTQEFSYGNVDTLENKEHVIVLQLKGKTKKKAAKNSFVRKPLVVNEKIVCDVCGKKNRSSHKFCVECGTSLI